MSLPARITNRTGDSDQQEEAEERETEQSKSEGDELGLVDHTAVSY